MRFEVGLDVRMHRHTGIGTYIREIVSHFAESNFLNRVHIFGSNSFSSTNSTLFTAPIYSIQEQFAYLSLLKKVKVWHAPHYNIPFFRDKTKLIVTIHDLIHWIFKDEFFTGLKTQYAQVMFQRVSATADHIITVSTQTKEDFIKFFNADPDKISVIHEAVSEKFRPSMNESFWSEVQRRYCIHKSFFVYVGMFKAHKNVRWLVDQYLMLKRQGKIQSDLILIGNIKDVGPDWPAIHNDSGIHFLHSIPFEDLLAFYSHATALVHPSRYEGFGLTLLEAMACGAPVIACRAGSIPEIVGNAAYLIDSDDSDALKDAMLLLEQSESIRSQLRDKGYARVKDFSWSKAAAQTIDVYEKVLKTCV